MNLIPLSIFIIALDYFDKNTILIIGIWNFTKVLNKVVGEERYDSLRVYRRIW